MIFDAYSEYYDLLYTDKNYSVEATYIDTLIKRYASAAKHILELGCGTGAHAEYLARMGYHVRGIDISEGMIERAQKRLSKLPNDIAQRLSFSVNDIRSARLEKTCDIAIALFHVMSYQNTNSDFLKVLNTAYNHLQNNGLFLFDYWYGPSVLTELPETRVRRFQNDAIHITRVAEPEIHFNRNVVDVNYVVTIKDKRSDAITELTEKHAMRYLFLPEIEQFASPHFIIEDHYEWLKDSAPNHLSWSALTVLKKQTRAAFKPTADS